MRYVGVTRIDFQDLEKIINKGPIYAVEVDQLRGILRIIHHSAKGISDRQEPSQEIFKSEEKIPAFVNWEQRLEAEANGWVDYLLRELPTVRFWLYPIEIPNEIHDSTSYFRKVLSPLMEKARETAPFDKEEPLVFCKMADNAHPPGIHIEGAHP